MTEESPTMETAECAKYIGCKIGKLRKMIHDKKIPYRKVGNRYIFDRPMIELWKKQSYSKEGFRYEF